MDIPQNATLVVGLRNFVRILFWGLKISNCCLGTGHFPVSHKEVAPKGVIALCSQAEEAIRFCCLHTEVTHHY